MRTLFLVFVFSAICISGNNANVESGSFLEADTDLRHLKRNLLQVVEDGDTEYDEGPDEAVKETTTEAVIERKGIFERGTILKGKTFVTFLLKSENIIQSLTSLDCNKAHNNYLLYSRTNTVLYLS